MLTLNRFVYSVGILKDQSHAMNGGAYIIRNNDNRYKSGCDFGELKKFPRFFLQCDFISGGGNLFSMQWINRHPQKVI